MNPSVVLWLHKVVAATGTKTGDWSMPRCLEQAREIVVQIKRGRL